MFLHLATILDVISDKIWFCNLVSSSKNRNRTTASHVDIECRKKSYMSRSQNTEFACVSSHWSEEYLHFNYSYIVLI